MARVDPLGNSFVSPFIDNDVGENYSGFCDAAECGRRAAAEAVRLDPSARKRVEEKYGLDFCRSRYPEAYKNR